MEQDNLSKLIVKKLEGIGKAKLALQEIFDLDLDDLLSKHNPIWDMIPEEVDQKIDFRELLYKIYYGLEEIQEALYEGED